jgi:predicted glutamine amidotransferase
MCRIFLSFDRKDTEVLIDNFIRQSHSSYKKNTPGLNNHRDNGPHKDGIGFAILQKKWVIYKSLHQSPIDFHPNNNDLIIGHLRKKCKDFPGHISENNTHPFYYKNQVMVHNGFLHDINVYKLHYTSWIAEDLLPHIKGETDSEIIFFIYLTFLRKESNTKYGLISAVKNMFSKFVELGHEISANIIFANNSYVLITRFLWHDPKKHYKKQHAPSLYYDVSDGIVISSEPLTSNYHIVPENMAFLIDIKHEIMTAHFIQ